MKRVSSLFVLVVMLALGIRSAAAQTGQPLILVMKADGSISPAMQTYVERGVRTAEQRGAEALIIELSTPGGDLLSLNNIIQTIRASKVPMVVYVAPNGAMAGSAGALVTMAGHVAAMAPEAAIGASSPVASGGQDLSATEKAKASQMMKATIRPLVTRRGPAATQLAQDMIDQAKAVSASEALQVHLIDIVASDLPDLVKQLDGFAVSMPNGSRLLHTSGARTESLEMSLIEQLLLVLTDANIVFILLAVGVLAVQVELTHPGAWVPGFIGITCLALAVYGLGLLPVNWFGLVFIFTAFVLFILDIKAPTHGALTAAGVGAFIGGALVLFNSPGVPAFQRVSVPLVVGVGLAIGLMFAAILTYALRAQREPVHTGIAALIGKTGTAKSDFGLKGQVQVEAELWTAEPDQGSAPIRSGDKIEVVGANGLHLHVRKV